MAWDPVKPFKCDCPDNFEGELCEKKRSKYIYIFLIITNTYNKDVQTKHLGKKFITQSE